jgi:hypothetical protein
MTHVALLGDSTFDNASYVRPGEDVMALLRQQVEPGLKLTLLARDGARLADVPEQLARLPNDVTDLIVSIGGNDALAAAILLGERVRTIEDAVTRLASLRLDFAHRYGSMLELVLRRRLKTALATIYEPHFSEPSMRAAVGGALPLFNDVITRLTFRHRLSLLDLRLVCNDSEDFTSGIEPSAHGSHKIATALAHLLGAPIGGPVSTVCTG